MSKGNNQSNLFNIFWGLDKKLSEANREAGIEQAIENANKKDTTWGEKALEYLRICPYETFMVEEVRVWAYTRGLSIPPHGRTWGSVIRKAAKKGIVKHVGFDSVSNPKAHRTPASVWRKK